MEIKIISSEIKIYNETNTLSLKNITQKQM